MKCGAGRTSPTRQFDQRHRPPPLDPNGSGPEKYESQENHSFFRYPCHKKTQILPGPPSATTVPPVPKSLIAPQLK